MPESPQQYNQGEGSGGIKRPINPRVIFGSILFFGVFTLIFGSFKIWRDIRMPTLARQNELQQIAAEQANSPAAQPIPSDPSLRTKDTDADGINDWEELNVYHTSPYLKDSDGDQDEDGVEIIAQSDPNCPKGNNCGGGVSATATGTAGALFSDLAPQQPEPTPPPDLTNLNAQQLRELLLSTGEVSVDQLQQVDDAALMQMYQEAIQQQTQPQ